MSEPTRQGKERAGKLLNTSDLRAVPFTEQMVTLDEANSAVASTPNCEVLPHDSKSAILRIYNVAALLSAVDDLFFSFPGKVDLVLPPVLTGIVAVFNKQSGTSTSSHPASQQQAAFSGAGSIRLNPNSTAQSSASIVPAIAPTIPEIWSHDIPTLNYLIFLGEGNTTIDAIRAKVTQFAVTSRTVTITIATPGVVTLNSHGFTNGTGVTFATTGTLPSPLVANTLYYAVGATTNTFEVALTVGGSPITTTGTQTGVQSVRKAVLPYPVFKPVADVITLTGQQLSLQQSADSTAEVSIGQDSFSYSRMWGNGNSDSNGVTVETQRLPATLHAAITMTSTTGGTIAAGVMSDTATVSVDTQANTVIIDGSDEGTPWVVNPITNDPAAATGTVTATVSPSGLNATSPPDIPRTGLYLYDTRIQDNYYGISTVLVTLIDFSIFA